MYRHFETKFGGLALFNSNNNAIVAHLIACIMDGAESYSNQYLIESFNRISVYVQFITMLDILYEEILSDITILIYSIETKVYQAMTI